MVSSRLKIQYCKVIIATSLVWFLMDVFLLMYFTDCTNTLSCENSNNNKKDANPNQGGLISRLLPKGKLYMKIYQYNALN